MKVFKIVLGVLLAALVVAGIAAPIGPMPGLLIGGTAAEVPASWGDTRPIHEIKLQKGEGPVGRTVIIWTVQVDGDMYVLGSKDSGWTQGIGAGGPVRMQMEGNLYELKATPVTEGQAGILEAWLDKYKADYPEIVEGFPSVEEGVRGSSLFRLTAR